MRRKIIAGNWKMNTSLKEGTALAQELNTLVIEKKLKKDTQVVIAPPFTHLTEILKVIDSNQIGLSSQNCASESKGAFTGEVSAEMIKSLGCRAVIIGHSERRMYYKEDNAILLKKTKQVLANQLEVIFCCGELLEERESGIQFEVVKRQLEETIFTLSAEDFNSIIIAYEPVWAIGTGKTATSAQAQEIHAYIRKLIADKFGGQVAENTTILYGGSCNAANAAELFSNKDVDGGLIGGASLKAADFLTIINAI